MHKGSDVRVAEAKSMAGVVGSGWLEGRRRGKKDRAQQGLLFSAKDLEPLKDLEATQLYSLKRSH